MPLDDETTLKLDSFGNVTTDSPYKKKIEKYFSLDPEAAKAFREVASLNAMRAAQRALEMYAEEKRRASTDDEKTLAFNRYTARGIVIQNLSGEMSFQDGKLTSASMTYISAISDLRGSKAPDRGAAPVSLLV
ncbi:hypothetical protein [Methylobacterium nigriterrae]|uniref:hypothetical protein n=1 Tax=Methylobacterium nigriterrae TaxID=3127512 RepID=UPI00301408DC